MNYFLPSFLVLDSFLSQWLQEDIGKGDRTTDSIFTSSYVGEGFWILKQEGIIAGLPIAERVFQLLDSDFHSDKLMSEGEKGEKGEKIWQFNGKMRSLLSGERVALNLVMRLSGIATATRQYVNAIADYPSTSLVDTRKTTPGLRILEKYASQVGGAINHRFALDDAIMIKDNHIQGAGSITKAVELIRQQKPYPLTIEVETSNLQEVKEAIAQEVDIIMLDNMTVENMTEAVKWIRQENPHIKIEASGNVTLDNIKQIAATGVDYISTSATITRSSWLDISMKIQ